MQMDGNLGLYFCATFGGMPLKCKVFFFAKPLNIMSVLPSYLLIAGFLMVRYAFVLMLHLANVNGIPLNVDCVLLSYCIY